MMMQIESKQKDVHAVPGGDAAPDHRLHEDDEAAARVGSAAGNYALSAILRSLKLEQHAAVLHKWGMSNEEDLAFVVSPEDVPDVVQ